MGENEESNFVNIRNYWRKSYLRKKYTFKPNNGVIFWVVVPIPPTGASPQDPTGDFRPSDPLFVESKKSLNYAMLCSL